jgi:hypothetical protein
LLADARGAVDFAFKPVGSAKQLTANTTIEFQWFLEKSQLELTMEEIT